MATKIVAPESLDDALRASVNVTRQEFVKEPAPESLATHHRAVKAFTGFVLRRKLPDEPIGTK